MQIYHQIHYGFTVGFRNAAIILFAFVCLCATPVLATKGTVLSDSDIRLYTAVFEAHRNGDYRQADAYFRQTDNKLLAGYVGADKYLSAHYRTSATEIEEWFRLYGSLPIADRMRRLGERKKAKLPPRPAVKANNMIKCDSLKRDELIDLIRRRMFADMTPARRVRAQEEFAKLTKALSEGRTKAAKTLLDSKSFTAVVPPADRALARTGLAFSYFLDGAYQLGQEQIQTALRSDSSALPITYYVGGLIEWQLKDYVKAAAYFAKSARQKESYPLIHAAASFWAARTHLKIGKYAEVGPFLEAAAQHPDTFYGLLALQIMGLDIQTAWRVSSPDAVKEKALAGAIDRFYALRQLGWREAADNELKNAFLSAGGGTKKTLLTIARENQVNLKSFGDLSVIDKEDYPLPNWSPQNGWHINKALIFAFVRQESCFNPQAKSVMGARGLMQIMPATAEIMARRIHISWQADRLEDVRYNLALGQAYIQYLLDLPAVNNNIIYMAVAYNAGPANLIKWKKKTGYPEDPLIFLERIPSRETRAFVERILSNFWVYQSLLGQKNKTAEQIVRGKWPLAGKITSQKK